MKTNTILLVALILLGVFLFLNQPKDEPPPKPKPQLPTPPPAEPFEPPSKEWTFQEALDSINSETLKKNLYYLASDELEGRMSGKKGNVTAAEFLKRFHEENGLPTEYQQFNIRRLNPGPNNEQGDDFTKNIFTWIEGSDPQLKDEIVIVGAHMDHIGYGPSMSRSRSRAIHPGADDNASGTVVVMEVARAFSHFKGKIPRTVVFQHYSGEEMGLLGSRYYCDNPTFPKNSPNIKSHIAMINLDMVGYLNHGYYFTGFHSGESSIDLTKIVRQLNGKYSFASRITSHRSGGSDHAPFYNKRIPVAFLHTGSHRYYHTPEDTPDKINYDGLGHVARYTFELAWNVVHDNAKPQFNDANFEPMEYKHDHGHSETPFIHEERRTMSGK